ncbi:baseplate wedge subunit [Acidovorax phage ACP17]|uniref:Baseplate wedge subunit n=1 Tax=Acidovorax phage ACP17 TaxID=2010329 RepID=A0A218M2T0_9CAUD|nr:baseplate wedge subunit [Acidovorax phage ACP17]ASD50357.1 baseplate wedge subunit [Acidovorax phage ACP17]
MLNLPVQSLEFEDIKQNYIEFLKGDPNYRDFNFEASGISTQMNILAYSTHMLGFYVKMLLDEAFVDSAHTREALLSHAKKTGYTPRGRRSARAEVQVAVSMDAADEPLGAAVLIPRGTSFSSANSTQDARVFQVIDDVMAKSRTQVGNVVTYTSPAIVVFEGLAQVWRFVVDNSVHNQRFVIKDKNVDLDSIRVNVRTTAGSSAVQEFKLAKFTDNITGTTPVFYVTTNEEGYYQIFFGNNVFGVQPSNGNSVEVHYVATNGLGGNGAKVFRANPTVPPVGTDYYLGNFSTITTTTLSPSSGGMEPETVDSLRFTIPNHYRRQNRLLTASDFRGVLLEEFRNIDSMNVWGGEKNGRRQYGKVFCSIKPKNALQLTGAAKSEIRTAILETYGIVGGDIVFVDPEYISADVVLTATVDRRKTNKALGEIEADIVSRVNAYNSTTLSKFESNLSDVDMLNAARADDSYITSIFSQKVLRKSVQVIYGSSGTSALEFANALAPSTLASSAFQYGGKAVKFIDDGKGSLFIVEAGTDTLFLNAAQGTVDYSTGLIQFRFPQFARIAAFTGTTGSVEFSGVPSTPDVMTDLNNIVRISSTRVVFK